MKQPMRRCAVYTRKSSEEGLDQDFNSLDAQRKSCLSYIASQKSEGWSAIKEHYDDGGFSGGNMERPFYHTTKFPLVTRAASSVMPVTPEMVAIWVQTVPPVVPLASTLSVPLLSEITSRPAPKM